MIGERHTYKQQHEDFVSHNNGTSPWEITVIASVAPLSVFLYALVSTWLFIGTRNRVTDSQANRFIIDFVTIVLPTLLGCTVLADHKIMMYTGLLCTCAGLLIIRDQRPSQQKPDCNFLDIRTEKRIMFISNFRAYVNIATAVTILAVDFAIFPRRFAKTELYGMGLMDVGVGSFVIANAIVSPEARGKELGRRSLLNIYTNVLQSVMSSVPLFLLGVARFVSVKSTNYHEHVTEYGVHWNFFFTLACVKVLSTLILNILPNKYPGMIGAVIAIFYQYVLSEWNLTEYVIYGRTMDYDDRKSFVSANREGICSCSGYLAIYFAGIQLGKFLLKKRDRLKEWLYAFVVLEALTCLFWFFLLLSEVYVDPVSRRMANLSYVVWMLAYNLQSLVTFLLVDLLIVALQHWRFLPPLLIDPHMVQHKVGVSDLINAINRNALMYFLLANIFTGLVNIFMETIYAPPTTSFWVLAAYLAILSGVSLVLHKLNINTKIW
ncbi:phosphatidylinositol-glycan biosynthesis class W protein isoform X1 [Lingula anatina]|uniref:Phosphatidylinositol-glycan biosynthesis class W protein n=1 Tax=Lingula anatina TaxID=7574 RepID=A0A1S3JDM5_LINAN|nr:phosphatidylinositol-glycan biosynthesis class W protein isoform X1 [Lingula anatina]XP_013407989.1 phosphatidylinositol-glycan biosynthesis class W protein isoform X1 [Lingula anatina]|eukprot:XP_013407978.1 phosphatidylinositol-glycan biosynthesis class W protein isoform X1 [Lingula anatina]